LACGVISAYSDFSFSIVTLGRLPGKKIAYLHSVYLEKSSDFTFGHGRLVQVSVDNGVVLLLRGRLLALLLIIALLQLDQRGREDQATTGVLQHMLLSVNLSHNRGAWRGSFLDLAVQFPPFYWLYRVYCFMLYMAGDGNHDANCI
jgi:hypothetical protein